VTMQVSGKDERVFIEANPQYKTINLYNSKFQRLDQEQRQELMNKPELKEGKEQGKGKEKNKGQKPVMVTIDFNSGKGASNLKKNLETTADIYSFIVYNMKVKPKFDGVTKPLEKRPF